MDSKLVVLFSSLFILFSCSNEGEERTIAGKDLSSVTHVFYNYVYPDQPATRTYTTNFMFNANRVNVVKSSVFHYNHQEPAQNYTLFEESWFTYDPNDRLIRVDQERYSDIDVSDIVVNSYEFEYEETNKLKQLLIKDGNGTLVQSYDFVYENTTIERKNAYYEDGNLMFYYETIFHTDSKQHINRQQSKGPIFDGADQNYVTQEASFDEVGNVKQMYFEGNPWYEYQYSDIKIPLDLPQLRLPFFGHLNFDMLLGEFDQIVESYGVNYISAKIPLDPSNPEGFIYKNTLSKDNYPLKIEVFYNQKVWSVTTYSYD